MTSVCACAVIVILLAYCEVAHARYSSRSRSLPACYSNFNDNTWTASGISACQNPLYKSCGSSAPYLCCSPDHYCCREDTLYPVCCRKEWNDFEIASIVCGAIAWVAIIIVLGICGVGNLILKLRSAKVFPYNGKSDNIQMKEVKK
ncbi:uncharacterized protein LOC128219549 [Mya arenaria]|uniref:uncharacterized protein LOC128219549 n=1 Tax=Mya arenaria TaxID=6604 RepID=UPI0022E78386|nr:uncharacterized protein LOC128219549 [Mya arenaria]